MAHNVNIFDFKEIKFLRGELNLELERGTILFKTITFLNVYWALFMIAFHLIQNSDKGYLFWWVAITAVNTILLNMDAIRDEKY